MKIFAMNDCDWWIGESLEACKADYIEECGDPSAVEDAYELTDEALDHLQFTDTDEDDAPIGTKRSFREQLAIELEQGGQFPRLFATTEF